MEITDAETITLPLDKDGTYEISEGKLPVTLAVSYTHLRLYHDAYLAACLNGEAALYALEPAGDLLQAFQALEDVYKRQPLLGLFL